MLNIIYIKLMLSPKYSNFSIEAGCDEAGRGCLAGPVVCAAVVFKDDLWYGFSQEKLKNSHKKTSKKPKNDLQKLVEDNYNDLAFLWQHLNDSKKLNESTRQKLNPLIKKYALAYNVTFISAAEVDAINVLNASLKGMQECILNLQPTPEYIIIDGNRALFSKSVLYNKVGRIFSEDEIAKLKAIPHQSIIKGDGKYLNIAAASVLAKTYRDDYMTDLHAAYPAYGWNKNKGYPTKDHKQAIKTHGICEHHRKSFKLFDTGKQLTLF